MLFFVLAADTGDAPAIPTAIAPEVCRKVRLEVTWFSSIPSAADFIRGNAPAVSRGADTSARACARGRKTLMKASKTRNHVPPSLPGCVDLQRQPREDSPCPDSRARLRQLPDSVCCYRADWRWPAMTAARRQLQRSST